MNPAEYQRAGELFDQLRQRPEFEQTEVLAAACAGQPELRDRVLRLLAAERKADDGEFLQNRALEDAARLIQLEPPNLPAPGTVVGNYRLASRVGAGGMGVVYEAEDLRLGRRVAVKVLPNSLTSGDGQERIQRFEREARATSSLNHPHIVSIYDAAFDKGCYYIAMELVEGHTMRNMIAADSGPTDTKTVLDLLGQTAAALSAAHQAGIVHRDIKPENIMVRPDGFVKVLDFGLAKLREPPSDPNVKQSDFRTRPGHLAGTIQYLSPEQVAGNPVDSRTDLFSLGVVAYELATGVRPFDGPSDGSVYDAILNRTPKSPSSIRPGLSSQIDRLILRALQKDPDRRFQTAADFRNACMELSGGASSSRSWGGWKAAMVAVIACAVAGAAWYVVRYVSRSVPLPSNFQRLTDIPGEENFPSLSPDGKQFVYASPRLGNWDIYLQRTGGSLSLNLTRDCLQDDTQPSLSPDGSRIVFHSERDGGGLFLMESTGENPRRVSTRGYLPAWSPDSRRIVYSSDTFIVPSARGAPVSRLHILDLADGSERSLQTDDAIQPNWSPHGDRIAYWGISAGGRRDIFTVAASGGPPVPVTADDAIDWYPVWSPDGGRLYFLSDRGGTMNIWRVAIDEHSGRALGAPEPVTVPAQYVGSLAFGRDGKTLVYSETSQRNKLARIGFDSAGRSAVGPPEWIDAEHTVSDLKFSPDGSQLVSDTVGDATEDLWVMNADGTGRRRLISDAHRNRAPEWSPDGKEILFLSDRGGNYGIWLIRVDGSGLRPLTTLRTPNMQKALWSPDGRRVLAAHYPGAPLILDPDLAEPLANPTPAPGLQDADYLMFSSWVAGPRGGLALGETLSGPSDEIVIYKFADATLEHTHIDGWNGRWLTSGNGPPYRYFIFLRGSDCLIYDRTLKRESRLFSAAPNRIYDFTMTPDEHRIYFTQTVRDADLWLARLDR